MSDAWLTARSLEETKAGWEGPRWRFKAEVEESEKAAARRARWERAVARRKSAKSA